MRSFTRTDEPLTLTFHTQTYTYRRAYSFGRERIGRRFSGRSCFRQVDISYRESAREVLRRRARLAYTVRVLIGRSVQCPPPRPYVSDIVIHERRRRRREDSYEQSAVSRPAPSGLRRRRRRRRVCSSMCIHACMLVCVSRLLSRCPVNVFIVRRA